MDSAKRQGQGGEGTSDEDEWGAAELDLTATTNKSSHVPTRNDDDDYWNADPKAPEPPRKESSIVEESPAGQGEPMILVNLTRLSEDKIHCRFDQNSVNDIEAVSQWRKKIEANYPDYAKNAELLTNGAVVPCGGSVWRPALSRLRAEHPGQYFVPIFPIKKGTD